MQNITFDNNSNVCISNKNYVLNMLRNIDSTTRSELLSIIDKEEQQEKELLEKNPNIKLEQRLNSVQDEIQAMRHEMRVELQNFKLQQQCNTSSQLNLNTVSADIKKIKLDNNNNTSQFKLPCINNIIDDVIDDYDNCTIFSFELLPLWIFFILICISVLSPIKSSKLFI